MQQMRTISAYQITLAHTHTHDPVCLFSHIYHVFLFTFSLTDLYMHIWFVIEDDFHFSKDY